MTTSSPTPSSVPHEPTRDNQLPETGHSQTETLFPAHATAVQRLRRQYGDELDAMTTGELLAMQSLINQRLDKVTEQQLASETKPTNNPDASLSLGDLSRIAEENHRRHYNFYALLPCSLKDGSNPRKPAAPRWRTKAKMDSKTPKISNPVSTVSIRTRLNDDYVSQAQTPQDPAPRRCVHPKFSGR